MAGPFLYQPGFGPRAAPACDLTVGWLSNTTVVPALLDSGADTTTIPTTIVGPLALLKVSEIPVSGAVGVAEVHGVYVVNLDFLGFSHHNHPVIALPGRPYALIGRDILNQYTATMGGPALDFLIT